MNIHRIFYPVLTLGPGNRIGIWTRGCARRCPGCMSPDLWACDPRCEMGLDALFGAVEHIAALRRVDGVTISGGEPVDQTEELLHLLGFLTGITDDVLLYTGYTGEELRRRGLLEDLLERTAVLVCGPYDETCNDGLPLRGSSNQEVLFASGDVRRRYAPVLAGVREVQPVDADGDMFLIGIL